MKTLVERIDAKGFALIGQLRLHQDDGRDEVNAQAKALSPYVDAVAVTDCPYGVVHMSGLAVASMLLARGIDPVLHLSSRDRNQIALKSDLLGAVALGVTTLLLQRGDPLPQDVQARAKQVFDIGAKRLLATAKQLSEFRIARGERGLFLGALGTVFDPNQNWRPAELLAKVDAGAQFVQTQACFDVELLARYMKFLVAARLPWRGHVVVSVPVLTTPDQAQWLHRNVRGAVVPERFVRGFENARDPRRHGIELAAETLKLVREVPGISGANLSTPGDPGVIAETIDRAGIS